MVVGLDVENIQLSFDFGGGGCHGGNCHGEHGHHLPKAFMPKIMDWLYEKLVKAPHAPDKDCESTELLLVAVRRRCHSGRGSEGAGEGAVIVETGRLGDFCDGLVGLAQQT